MTATGRKTAEWCLAAVLVALVQTTAFAQGSSKNVPMHANVRAVDDQGTQSPLRIAPFCQPILKISNDDLLWLNNQISFDPAAVASPSYFLHILRTHGLSGAFPSEKFPTGEALLIPLLRSDRAEEVFGKSALVSLQVGARFQSRLPVNTPPWREYHRDQNLSGFAELGLPLSTPLYLRDAGSLVIGDVLQDSLRNFHLRQEEIEWTALAYALYLPPRHEWVNRFGEKYSFDDLANELMRRSMVEAACGGAHFLFSLTMIVRADAIEPILSEDVRAKAHERLKLCSLLAINSQQPDGCWRGDWFFDSPLTENYRGPTPVSTSAHKLVVTGHLSEWMLYLPEELQVPKETQLRACEWLLIHLKQMSDKDKNDQFCPCTHAICVLLKLAFVP